MRAALTTKTALNGTTTNILARLTDSVQRAAVIDADKLTLIVAALVARGHVLLEDVPGIGKTLVAKALARSLEGSFKRIQCTPDLLPGDVTGGAIYNQRESRFEFVPGPIFANVVLVDEINRASPRTQSSLLESMAEGQVTVDGVTRMPLPEAQLDRFLIALNLGYPSFEDEIGILEREEHADPLDSVQPALTLDEVIALQTAAQAVSVVRSLKEYIVTLAQATRAHPDAVLGVSPRGGAALQRMAQALALMRGRTFVNADDIKFAARAVMPHRLLTRDRLSETARAVVESVMGKTPVPVDR